MNLNPNDLCNCSSELTLNAKLFLQFYLYVDACLSLVTDMSYIRTIMSSQDKRGKRMDWNKMVRLA